MDDMIFQKDNTLKTAAVFLNFEKDFDKVWHTGLILKINFYQSHLPDL